MMIYMMMMMHSFCDINCRGGHPNVAINPTPTHPVVLTPVCSRVVVRPLHVPLSSAMVFRVWLSRQPSPDGVAICLPPSLTFITQVIVDKVIKLFWNHDLKTNNLQRNARTNHVSASIMWSLDGDFAKQLVMWWINRLSSALLANVGVHANHVDCDVGKPRHTRSVN